MRKRLILLSAAALVCGMPVAEAQTGFPGAGTAPSQPAPNEQNAAPAGSGEPLLKGSESFTTDPLRLSALLEHFAQDAFDMLRDPLAADIDMSLSYKMMSFYHIQVDMSQVLLRYSTDPELRRTAARDIELASERIATLRNWQVNRQILQQQITGSLPLTPQSFTRDGAQMPSVVVPQRPPAAR